MVWLRTPWRDRSGALRAIFGSGVGRDSGCQRCERANPHAAENAATDDPSVSRACTRALRSARRSRRCTVACTVAGSWMAVTRSGTVAGWSAATQPASQRFLKGVFRELPSRGAQADSGVGSSASARELRRLQRLENGILLVLSRAVARPIEAGQLVGAPAPRPTKRGSWTSTKG